MVQNSSSKLWRGIGWWGWVSVCVCVCVCVGFVWLQQKKRMKQEGSCVVRGRQEEQMAWQSMGRGRNPPTLWPTFIDEPVCVCVCVCVYTARVRHICHLTILFRTAPPRLFQVYTQRFRHKHRESEPPASRLWAQTVSLQQQSSHSARSYRTHKEQKQVDVFWFSLMMQISSSWLYLSWSWVSFLIITCYCFCLINTFVCFKVLGGSS